MKYSVDFSFFDSMIINYYYSLITMFDHYVVIIFLSRRFVSNSFFLSTIFQQILNLNTTTYWSRRSNNSIQSISNFDSSFSNPSVSQKTLLIVNSFLAWHCPGNLSEETLLIVNFFLTSHHSEKCCFFALHVIFARCDIDKTNHFIQSFYQIFIIISCAWFFSTINFLIIKIITNFTTVIFTKFIRS